MKYVSLNNQGDWQRVKFGSVVKIRKGLTYKSSNYSDEREGFVFLTLKSIQRGGGFNAAGIKYYSGDFDSSAVVGEGDLVIANTDITRGAEVVGAPMVLPRLSEKPVLISMDLSALDVDEGKASKRFLYYLLQDRKARNFMRDHSSGSTVLHLKTKDVPDFAFLAPPLLEQKKIAEILGSVDAEIAKTDEIIVATEKLKRGLMQRLFTRGIEHTNFKKTEIGEVPVEWDTGAIGELCETASGGTPSSNKPEYYENGGIPWLNSGEVRQGRVVSASQYITNLGLEASSAKIFLKGTVVVAMYGATAGQVGIMEFDAATNQAICGIVPSNKLLPEFLYYYLSGKTGEMMSLAKGAAQPNISQSVIRRIHVPVPTIEEQKRIAGLISAVDETLLLNRRFEGRLSRLKHGLAQDLLDGSVRVVS